MILYPQTVNVLPSISHVEYSCLITLNSLLSPASATFSPVQSQPSTSNRTRPQWLPILPTRRHSMPILQVQEHSADDTSSALRILLDNLRSLDTEQGMVEAGSVPMDEIATRVHSIASNSSLLDAEDVQLANALVDLLTHVRRLGEIYPSSSILAPEGPSFTSVNPSENIYDTLSKQMIDLKDEAGRSNDGGSSRVKVERALLWNKIDEELDIVSRLCRKRMGGNETGLQSEDPFADIASLPPEYEGNEHEPPEYRTSFDSITGAGKHYTSDKKAEKRLGFDDERSSMANYPTSHEEKMRLDFEAITMAIDRLYLVAPQLHNQRVELKKQKQDELKRAAAGKTSEGVAVSRKGSGVYSTPGQYNNN